LRIGLLALDEHRYADRQYNDRRSRERHRPSRPGRDGTARRFQD
jgi:hypothetical protein